MIGLVSPEPDLGDPSGSGEGLGRGDAVVVVDEGAASSSGFAASMCMEGGLWTGLEEIFGIGEVASCADVGEEADSEADAVAGFGVLGSGIERGERMLLVSADFVGVPTAGEFIFSERRGFVVEMFSGMCFFAAATFAASAPSWRIARFCSAFAEGSFSFLLTAGVDVAEDAAGAGVAFTGAGADDAPSASLSSSYSFHSSI